MFHKRSKHIEINYHWNRDHVSPGGRVTARLVECTDQAADLFTMVLCYPMFEV